MCAGGGGGGVFIHQRAILKNEEMKKEYKKDRRERGREVKLRQKQKKKITKPQPGIIRLPPPPASAADALLMSYRNRQPVYAKASFSILHLLSCPLPFDLPFDFPLLFTSTNFDFVSPFRRTVSRKRTNQSWSNCRNFQNIPPLVMIENVDHTHYVIVSKFNGSHIGLPPSASHRMTVLAGKQFSVYYDVCARARLKFRDHRMRSPSFFFFQTQCISNRLYPKRSGEVG